MWVFRKYYMREIYVKENHAEVGDIFAFLY